MAERVFGLTVIKHDGLTEEYIHTKVVGAIVNALGSAGLPDINAAEELAEAVTFFLYKNNPCRPISTSEILSIIETVLASTGFEDAAVALSEHHYLRKLRRCRIEVVVPDDSETKSRWDKSRIVEDLVNRQGLDRLIARTIASMVEEKVFNMGVSTVSTGLIKQLVLSDAAAVSYAQKQLQSISPDTSSSYSDF
jgi:transcriptional regulator NrdR family protein